MKKSFSLLICLGLSTLIVHAGNLRRQDSNVDPHGVLKQIQKLYRDAQASRATGQIPNEAEIQERVKSLVANAIAGVDPKSVPADEAADWLKVFQIARREDAVAILAQRTSGQQSFQAMETESYVIRDLIRQGKVSEGLSHIRGMGFAGPSMIGQFHLGIAGALKGQAKAHLKEVLAIYDVLIARTYYNSPITASDRNWGPVAYANLMSEKYALIYEAGRKDEAMRGLKSLSSEMARHADSKDAYAHSAQDYVVKTISRLTSPEAHASLLGHPAPPLFYDRWLGNYSPASLSGKVVVLDFMAHWCGPCKAALPDLAKLQASLGSQGLQIVSLTGYYGYFGAERGITPAAEFDKMKGFVTDFKMAWPVLFDAKKKNDSSYGVTGIPQLVIIDRKGVVRKVDIGYTPDSFAESVKMIKQLLAE